MAFQVAFVLIIGLLFDDEPSPLHLGFRLPAVAMDGQPETLGIVMWCVAKPHTLLVPLLFCLAIFGFQAALFGRGRDD